MVRGWWVRECDTILQSHALKYHRVHISQDTCDLHMKLLKLNQENKFKCVLPRWVQNKCMI